MPTYLNRSNQSLTIKNKTFKYLEETPVDFNIDLNDYPNLKKTSDDPVYCPLAFSKILKAGEEINLSEFLTNEVVSINLVSRTETSKVIFNDPNSFEATLTINTPVDLRNVDHYSKLFVTEGEISVELWKGFKWRN